jgi:hypothetical protein
MTDLQRRVAVSRNQIHSSLGEEIIILDLYRGTYHGLSSVGARIWELLQEPKTVENVLNVLLDEYDVDPKQCKTDLLDLLERLQAQELIEVKDAEAV